MEYDRFFYRGNRIELADALDTGKKDLQKSFDKDALFCPECFQAQLRFTKATSAHKAFLSTKQPSEHDHNAHAQWCYHFFTRASKAEVREYYKSLSDAQIRDKLDAAIEHYLRHNRPTPHVALMKPENNPGIAVIRRDGGFYP